MRDEVQTAKFTLRDTGSAEKRRHPISVLIRCLLHLDRINHKVIGKVSRYLEPDRLHPKHRLMQYHDFFLENIEAGWTVVDLGCGNGALTCDLAKKAGRVIGLDFDIEKIRQAKVRAEEMQLSNVQLEVGNIHEYCPQEPFNSIVLSNVLEHLDNRHGFLLHCRKIASVLIIRVPMLDRDWLTLYKRMLGLPYFLDPTHRTEYTDATLSEELSSAGWTIVSAVRRFGETWAVCRVT